MARSAAAAKAVASDDSNGGSPAVTREAGQEFVVERDRLLRAVQQVASVVEARNTIPILSNLLIDVAGGQMRVTGTNLNQWACVTVAARDQRDEVRWTTTVPSQGLVAQISAWPMGAEVAVVPDGRGLALRCGRARAQLHSLPPGDFPLMQWTDGSAEPLTIAAKDLLAALSRVAPAMSAEEIRYYMYGIFVDTAGHDDGHIRLVATDGARVHMVPLANVPKGWPVSEPGVGGDGHVILPSALVRLLSAALAKVPGDVSLTIGTGVAGHAMVRAAWADTVIISKLIDGIFPDYRRVFPAARDDEVHVSARALSAALGGIMAVASDKTRGVKLDISADKISAQCTSAEVGTSTDEIPAATSRTIGIGFNGKYLNDLISAAAPDGQDIILTPGDDPCVPVALRRSGDDGWRGVIMPLRF